MKKTRMGLFPTYILALPAINPKNKVYEPYIEKMNFYREFLSVLDAEDRFTDIALEMYNSLVEGIRIKERDYKRVIDMLEWEIEKELTEIIMELKDSQNREQAEFMEKYLEERDFQVLYKLIVDIIEKRWERIKIYFEILKFLKATDIFNKVGIRVFKKLSAKKWVRDIEYQKADSILGAEVRRRIFERIKELRDSGFGREADKVEEYLKKGDFENAYHALQGISEIKKVETEEVDTKQFLKSYIEAYNIIEALHRAGVGVEDIKWSLGEILGINSMKIPEDRVILVDDSSGNAACFISIYLKRIGAEYTFFSTSGIGNYWITNIEEENRLSPTLQASKLGESIISSKGIVLLEDINYLINTNKFSEVYRFLYYIKNNVEDRIIFTVNLKTLSEREKARLKSIADKVVKMDFPINICSLNMVAVENRPDKGALLLSKERIEDFEGKTYIITDFGGENTLHPQRIDFEIVDKIAENIDYGDVIIDALDMLIDENGLDKIYVWLKFIRDIALKRGKRIYIVTRDLVANERMYIRPIMDMDTFHVVNMDKKKLSFLQKKMRDIRRVLEKRVEKECVYSLEMIKHRYQKYQKYLADLREDINRINDLKEYNVDCVLKIAPIRKEIDKRVEEIENIIAEFNDIKEKLNMQIQVLKIYVDTKELENNIKKAQSLIDAGDYKAGIELIKDCEDSLPRYYRQAVSKAWNIRENIRCIDYLLPPYHKEKIMEFEGEREKLKDFTLLYMAIRNLIIRKIENEYKKLENYAKLANIPIFKLGDAMNAENYCNYRKKRDEFLFEFEKVKGELVNRLKEKITATINLLEKRGYDIQNIGENIDQVDDIDSLIDIWNRLSHHLVRYVENHINNLRDRCPRCINEEVAHYLLSFRQNPMEFVDSLGDFLKKMDELAEREEQELRDMTRELENYYRTLDKLGINYQKRYPKRIEQAREILNSVRVIMDSLTPNIVVELAEWNVDETRTINMKLLIKNSDKYEAKNVTLEIHGAASTNKKIPLLPGMRVENINVSAEIRDPDSPISIDIVYVGPGGNITTKSFEFNVNLKGYSVSMASGSEKCALCRGKIFKDTEMVTCSKCGATYHLQCAKRAGKCKICGTVFLFKE